MTISLPSFYNKKEHLRILSLTFPMILANITTPLIGLVDTAVLGHLEGAHFLAGASIGALILTQLYWICGFIRMSTTGLSAQAKGEKNLQQAAKVLYQGLALGALLGVLIFLLQSPILHIGVSLSAAGDGLRESLTDYFSVRVYGAPAALMNLALIGWLIGQQHARQVMAIQILANLINAGLDIWFVMGLGWQVKGVALASIIAEYFILASSLWVVQQHLQLRLPNKLWFTWSALKEVFTLSGNMFVRNLFLQLCLAFLTFQGARLGQMTAATNAIIMQFFVLIALGLDAVAYAVEALVGEAQGAKDKLAVRLSTLRGLAWSGVFAVVYTLTFWLAGDIIINLLTDLPVLRTSVAEYLWIVLMLPLVGHWCFLFDGVYIGLTKARIMRNTMIISACLVFFPVWWILQSWGNIALWAAFLAFLGARSFTLGWHFMVVYPRETVLKASG